MGRTFFFYGTLVHGMPNPVAKAIHRKLGPGRAGTVLGRLFAIELGDGCYPALIADADGYPVHGNAYEATPDFTSADLALLDQYEEFYPGDPASSEYLRQSVAVELAQGKVIAADTYLYHAPLPPEAREISGGSFSAYLDEQGLQPLSRI